MPDFSRRLSTWSAILSTYDIMYVTRKVIKAQSLVNFIVAMTLVVEATKPSKEKC